MKYVTYTPPADDPSFPEVTSQFGFKFRAGQSVPVSKPDALKRFEGNRFFKVTDKPIEGSEAQDDGDLSVAKTRIERLEKVITDGRAAHERLSAELKASQDEVARLDGELKSAKADNERLSAELDAAREEIAKLQASAKASEPKTAKK